MKFLSRARAKKWLWTLFLLFFAFSSFQFFLLVLSLNRQIDNSLEKGWFEAPVEYYSSSETLHEGKSYSLEKLKTKLQERNYYKSKNENQPLPGQWITQLGENCTSDSSAPEAVIESCLTWTDLQTEQIFTVHFADNNIHSLKISGNATDSIQLAPILFAQYQEETPILKQFVPLEQIPFYCRLAVLTAEDNQFVTHEGISPKGILRAIWRNIKARHFLEGGSTITQQLVKNRFLNPKKTLKRKFNEQVMAILLETKLDKDEILTAYLNTIYMGQSNLLQIYGFGSASSSYIGKPISHLNLSECAFLSALIKAPGRYNPLTHKKQSLKRRNHILRLMHEKKFISMNELQEAKNTPLPSIIKKAKNFVYFTDAVHKRLKQLGLGEKKGLKVFTTLNLKMQEEASQAITSGLKFLEKHRMQKKSQGPELQTSLISVNIATAQVLAVIGGRNFKTSQFNRVIQSQRQIGSLMKPVVVLSALVENPDLNPLSIIKDEKFSYKYGKQVWSPKNYKDQYRGEVPLYEALTFSLNTAIAKLGLEIGVKQIIQTIKHLGGPAPSTEHPSLILGAIELTPWEVAQMFLTVSRMGEYKKQYIIEKVTNFKNKIIYQHPEEIRPAFDEKKVAVLVGMLREVSQSGTARRLKNFPTTVAGKTGTTNDERDSWFVGFTPEILTLVWVGFDNNQPHHLTGSQGALPLWERFMKKIADDFPKENFSWPEGVFSKTIFIKKAEPSSDEAITASSAQKTKLSLFQTTKLSSGEKLEPSPIQLIFEE